MIKFIGFLLMVLCSNLIVYLIVSFVQWDWLLVDPLKIRVILLFDLVCIIYFTAKK